MKQHKIRINYLRTKPSSWAEQEEPLCQPKATNFTSFE